MAREYLSGPNIYVDTRGINIMAYHITLTIKRTGKPFMYHSTPKHEEALRLVDRYNKFDGVSVKMEQVEHA